MRDDFAYLIDFGIARAADETRLTKSGNTIGTFQYIAPERLGTRAEEDARADIYSLACVLYECLTGRPPFAGDTMAGLVAAHLNTPPPQPSATQPNVPAQIDEVIATGMAKDPEQRYATTVELANAAHDAVTTPIRQPVPPPTRPGTGTDVVREASQPTRPAIGQHVAPPGAVAPSAATLLDSPSGPPLQGPAKPGLQPAGERPPTEPLRPRRWWRRQAIMIPAALLSVAVIAAAIVITSQQQQNSNGPQITLPTGTQHREPAYGSQVTLPFTGLYHPYGVAVDTAGDLYVTDGFNDRVLKLAAGSGAQAVLPFTGLNQPRGVAVDTAGNLYVVEVRNNRVVKLPAG